MKQLAEECWEEPGQLDKMIIMSFHCPVQSKTLKLEIVIEMEIKTSIEDKIVKSKIEKREECNTKSKHECRKKKISLERQII